MLLRFEVKSQIELPQIAAVYLNNTTKKLE